MSEKTRVTPMAWAGQLLLYGLFAAFIGIFSQWPPYQNLADDQALIKVSFTHSGKPVSDCRPLSPAELAKLPPNMRAPVKCPRERSPVTIEVDLDGTPMLHQVIKPAGLSRDGASAVYRRLEVKAGPQLIAVRLKDDVRSEGFDYQREQAVTLKPAQILVIDFDASKGGITIQ